MRRLLELGGYLAAVVLLAFGVAALVLGVNGRSEVSSNLKREQIFGGADMYPDAIRAAAAEAGLAADLDYPSCSVYDADKAAADSGYKGEPIDDGGSAKCFASYMRIHALESSEGLVYAQMGRFQAANDPANPAGTNDPAAATQDADGNPVANGKRNTWVTETALATALNVSFFAERVSMFSIVVAIALILAGVGFALLAFTAFHRARGEQSPPPGEPAT